ncbi:MAG TPA: alpha/beta hydrolase [Acetobacterium sp.]
MLGLLTYFGDYYHADKVAYQVMASDYVASHPGKVSSLVFMAAYPNTSLAQSNISVLSLYGSEDHVLNRAAFEQAKGEMPTDVTYHEIVGGNHGNFGNYGEQQGDGTATISASEQQAITAERIKELWGEK